eukprot:gene32731-40398_t
MGTMTRKSGVEQSGQWGNDKFIAPQPPVREVQSSSVVIATTNVADLRLNSEAHIATPSPSVAIVSPLKTGNIEAADRSQVLPTNIQALLLQHWADVEPRAQESSSSFVSMEDTETAPPPTLNCEAQGNVSISGTISYPDCRMYRGRLLALKRHGCGLLTDAAGDVLYDGEWWNDQRHGRGLMSGDSAGCVVVSTFTKDSGQVHRAVSLIHGVALYQGHFEHDKRQDEGVLVCLNGVVHEGVFAEIDGRVIGKGTITFCDGQTYTGYTLDFKRHGRGVRSTASGRVIYDGEWLHDKRHGWGKKSLSRTGNVYEGNFHAGVRQGKGTMNFAGGGSYVGDWLEGERHGHGKEIYPDQRGESVYEGGFVMGAKSVGTLHYAGGSIYSGEWADGKWHGQGKYTCTKGSVYEGLFVRGNKQGHGTMRYPGGAHFVGEWENNKRHGEGKYTSTSGDTYEGSYVAGAMEGHGVMHFAEGGTYTGDWKADKRSGLGKETYPSSAGGVSVYEGPFIDDKKHGVGKFTSSQGWIYTGPFVEDLSHGEGQIVYSSGLVYT